MARSDRPSSSRVGKIGENSSDNDTEPEMQYLCTACQHAPFSSTKALHVHRTRHQLRADVTLPDGTSEIITRPNEAASWSCPEHACHYASDQLLSLRAHLRYRRQKRRRQEDEQQERREGEDDGTLPASGDAASSQRDCGLTLSPSLPHPRAIRRRLGASLDESTAVVSRKP